MKRVLLLVTVLALNLSSAQELSINRIDEFTGREVKLTNYYISGSGDFGNIKTSFMKIANVKENSEYYYIKIYSNRKDFGCAGSVKNYLILLFDDGTKLELKKDVSDISCADYSSSIYVLSADNVTKLKTKIIKKIRFAQSKGYADYNITGEYTLSQQINALN